MFLKINVYLSIPTHFLYSMLDLKFYTQIFIIFLIIYIINLQEVCFAEVDFEHLEVDYVCNPYNYLYVSFSTLRS